MTNEMLPREVYDKAAKIMNETLKANANNEFGKFLALGAACEFVWTEAVRTTSDSRKAQKTD